MIPIVNCIDEKDKTFYSNPILLSKSVTKCLTKKHRDCSGAYIDVTHSVKILCLCKCHYQAKRGRNRHWLPYNIRDPSLEASNNKKKDFSNNEEIVTKYYHIEDRIDCLQRHVALCCGSIAENNKILSIIRYPVLRILKENRTKRINSQ